MSRDRGRKQELYTLAATGAVYISRDKNRRQELYVQELG